MSDRWVARNRVVHAVRLDGDFDLPSQLAAALLDSGADVDQNSGDWVVFEEPTLKVSVVRHEDFIRHYQRHDYWLNRPLPDIADEMARQLGKWGEQNHPSKRGTAADYTGMYNSDQCRERADLLAEMGQLTWADILMEEVAEALDADNLGDLRAELVQVAAVAASWIESIDRNGQ